MGLFENCILACDIDGTLLVNEYINPRNIEKIDYFISEGGYFSLSTGRTLGAVSSVLEQLDHISPSVVANGCMIYDFENSRPLYEVNVPESDYHIVKMIYDADPNIGIEVHSGADILTVRRTSETDDHQRYERLNARAATFEEACNYKWNKVVFMFDSVEHRESVKQLTASVKNDCTFLDTCAEFGDRVRYYYEQVPKGISKAVTLSKLCEILNIKNGGLFAIGDYYNDLEMIKKADISAVTKDTPDDIKQYANFVGGTCRDGAVADFIDYLINKLNAVAF